MKIVKNSSHTIEITGITHEGQGVGAIEGFPVVVDMAIPGEIVAIKIIKVLKSFAIGKLNTILKPAKERVQPFCPVFKRCGGCSLQHLSYAAQLELKTDVVNESLKNVGGLKDRIIHAIIGMQNPLHYRNKAQYPVGRNKGAVAIGFYAKRSHEIIEHEGCAIQDEQLDRIKVVFREFLVSRQISVYAEEQQQGLIRYLMVRVGVRTGEIMVVIVMNGNDFPGRKELIKNLVSAVPEISSVVLNINERDTTVILGTKDKVVYGKDTITDYIGDCRFEISPLSFYQVNPVQTEVLYHKVVEYAGLSGSETVFDLYSGIGAIALFLARHAYQVYGVESVPDAVRDARRNAKINGLKYVTFIPGEAEQVIPELDDQGVRADVVVVDPPRKGCEERMLKTLVKMKPARIVYVSCHPTALARDLRYLTGNGFRVVEVQPVDMFPHTAHVECVVRIDRKNP